MHLTSIWLNQLNCLLADDTCCCRTLSWKTSGLHLKNKSISSQPASICWWKLSWLQDNISWTRMGHSGGCSTAKGFLCAWKTVRHNNIVLNVYLHFLSYSVLPAISLEKGILHCEIVEGSFRSDTFAIFIQNLLDHAKPFPGPNSVIVMDNCRIHKNPYIQEMIHARYILWLDGSNLHWQSNYQRCPLWISTTILSGLQPYWACFLVDEVLPLSPWGVCSFGHDYNDTCRSLPLPSLSVIFHYHGRYPWLVQILWLYLVHDDCNLTVSTFIEHVKWIHCTGCLVRVSSFPLPLHLLPLHLERSENVDNAPEGTLRWLPDNPHRITVVVANAARPHPHVGEGGACAWSFTWVALLWVGWCAHVVVIAHLCRWGPWGGGEGHAKWCLLKVVSARSRLPTGLVSTCDVCWKRCRRVRGCQLA